MGRNPTRLLSLAAVGVLMLGAAAAVWYGMRGVPDDSTEQVSGPVETATPVVVIQKTDENDASDLDNYRIAISSGRDPYFGTGQRDDLLDLLGHSAFQGPSGYVNVRVALAFDYLRFGEVDEAIRVLKEALERVELDGSDPRHLGEVLEELAITSLKQGELSNRTNPSARLVCTLPLGNAQGLEDRTGPTNAIAYLTRLLKMHPGDVRYRWLLNVAHMTLGTYPEGVPEQLRVPDEGLASGYDIGRFEEIAAKVGMDARNLAGGSIMDDFDNDGLLDIVTSTWDPGGAIIYYHNEGDGTFSDYTERAELAGQLGGLNIAQTDYNNDGWLDIFVMRGGWLRTNGAMRVSLLRNNADGTFSDVTWAAGLARPAYPSQTSGWADYDNDGDLDLFACNESQPESDFESEIMKFPSQLFRNNGDGTFTDVAAKAGVRNDGYCKGSVWGDYDNDGDPDLYLSNFATENRLFRNDGDGTFTDVAVDLGVEEPLPSFATWFWDYNNDGWLDLWVAGYWDSIEDVASDYLDLPNIGKRMRLYRNDGVGGFVDVTRESGLYRVHLTMAANFGDLDNDGWLDFYLGTGYPSYDALGPNIAYRNNDGHSFTDVTFSAGLGHLHKGHGIAFGDLDRDGDQDIFAQIGGFYPGDGFENALYENPGHGNRWLSVKLVGVETNRPAIGARIRLKLMMSDGSTRDVYSRVNSGGSFGASSLEQEMGLGQAEGIHSLEVFWPTSGTTQLFEDLPLDSRIEVTEGKDSYDLLDTRTLRLGG